MCIRYALQYGVRLYFPLFRSQTKSKVPTGGSEGVAVWSPAGRQWDSRDLRQYRAAEGVCTDRWHYGDKTARDMRINSEGQ